MILALEIRHENGERTIWAFDDAEQYRQACWIVHANGLRWKPHHAFDRANKPFPLTNIRDQDAFWLTKSEGINDAHEVERCLYERGELLPSQREAFETEAFA